MSNFARRGYLVLADISGYTSFVAKTELEHSHEILTELLELLVAEFQPLMTISKLEGDAVFAYVDEEEQTRGEILIEFMESVYAAFRDKQVSMRRKTTCTCAACRNISSLDLKFIVHYGDYIVQTVANIRELVGTDVNLVHRLSKNHVSEATGWRAYILLTEKCLNCMQLDLPDAHLQLEAYEHLGELKTRSIDLHARYRELTDERRVRITEEEADLTLNVDFRVPPHIAWEWMQDPSRRNIWCPDVKWSIGDRPRGRRGRGASNHCAHGKGISTEVVLDWRPFHYVTVHSIENGKVLFMETAYFEALPDGTTRFRDCISIRLIPGPRPLRRILGWFIFIVVNKYDKLLADAARLAEEDYGKSKESARF